MSEMNHPKTILYVHGMGGGGDSRIPSILKDILGPEYSIFIKTYDFDPEVASAQLAEWASEVRPDLVIGESMGAIHALALRGYPHLFVSPSLNAPLFFRILAALALIPGVTRFFDWYYHPKAGDRQPLHFARKTLLKWPAVRRDALKNTPALGSGDYFHAFFGTRDHFRRSGVVLVRTWRKYFGEGSWTMYEGSHFMEEEHIRSLLVPKILSLLV
ncbi:MAG: hypothetical protein IJ840_02400 [Bacteroidales bacterium]|nr:hypothetical protein [Bacteroidales bacterium]